MIWILGLDICIGDCDWALELKIKIEDWDWRLGIWIWDLLGIQFVNGDDRL